MCYVRSGVNTKKWRKPASRFFTFIAAAMVAVAFGCSGETDQVDDTADMATSVVDSSDFELIQAMFTEVAVRWHHGDKAVLYDLEFEYLQDKYTFDEYLEFRQIQYLEADTLEALMVKDVEFFGRDSATVTAEAVFIGPTGDTSYYTDKYRVHFHRGRWIRATAGSIDLQIEYEELRRVADSAAEAEAELEDL
jgi:hypothetical protein